MTIHRTRMVLVSCALALLAGCGLPGAPQPPSLELPRPVADLRAARRGDTVTLTWTRPSETTDGQRVRRLGATRVCRALVSSPPRDNAPRPGCTQFVAAVDVPPTPPQPRGAQATFVDTLPSDLIAARPLDFALYTVEVLNDRARTAGPSNLAALSLAPTLPPPANPRAQVTHDAIDLTWDRVVPPSAWPDRLGYGYRIEREQPANPRAGWSTVVTPAQVAGPAAQDRYRDQRFDWDRQYRYRICTVSLVPGPDGQIIVEGDWSPWIAVDTRDVYPPDAPAGLQAIFTEAGADRFIDLTWLPSPDADLAGYHVFRREDGVADPVRITSEPLKTPTFRDPRVEPGHRYFYSVSAVDVRGNESVRSPEASELVPPPPQ